MNIIRPVITLLRSSKCRILNSTIAVRYISPYFVTCSMLSNRALKVKSWLKGKKYIFQYGVLQHFPPSTNLINSPKFEFHINNNKNSPPIQKINKASPVKRPITNAVYCKNRTNHTNRLRIKCCVFECQTWQHIQHPPCNKRLTRTNSNTFLYKAMVILNMGNTYDNKTNMCIWKYVNLLHYNHCKPPTCFSHLLWPSWGRCFHEGYLYITKTTKPMHKYKTL